MTAIGPNECPNGNRASRSMMALWQRRVVILETVHRFRPERAEPKALSAVTVPLGSSFGT